MQKKQSQGISSSLHQIDTNVSDCYEMQIRTFYSADNNFLDELVQKYAVKNLLDIGCGEGSFILNFAKKFPQLKIHAVETVPNLVKSCLNKQRNTNIQNVTFQEILFDESFPLSNFDMVTARFAVEHMQNISNFLSCAYENLKPQGIIAITEYCVLIEGLSNPIWKEFREREINLYQKIKSHAQVTFGIPYLLQKTGFHNISSHFIQISPSTVDKNDFYDLVDIYASTYSEIDSENWSLGFVEQVHLWTKNERKNATCDPAMWLTQTKAEK